MDAFEEIGKAIDAHQAEPQDPYYFFEPFDVKRRSDEVKGIMAADGVDLYDGDFAKHVPSDPHPFQTGYFMSTRRIRCILGASRIGKSVCPMIELVMMATGEFPFCFRYASGVVTPTKRKVTPENIRRWGRRDSSTGILIDFDVNAPAPQAWKEWDCGNIVGVGLYPQEKVAPVGAQIWLGTYAEAKARYWWPRLAEPSTRMIPNHMFDIGRGNEGINRSSDEIYLIRNITVPMLTYEQGHKRFEAERAWTIICDEETPTREIFASALKHCKIGLSQVFTPLRGITWSKRQIMPATGRNPDVDLFHASAYDSPYVDRSELLVERKVLQPWELQSRHWGLFAEAKGEPFFDRTKLNKWVHTSRSSFTLARLRPSMAYEGFIERSPYMPSVPSLMEVKVLCDEVDERDMQTTWKLYEDPMEGVGYIAAVDVADGGETPDEASDTSQAFIMRPPIKERSEVRPVVAATLRSTLPPIAFARPVALGMRLYNFSKLAAETKRGWGNGVFSQQFLGLPDMFWISYTSIHSKTGRTITQKGFDPNQNNRPIIFELIKDYIDFCDDSVGIEDEDLLKELAAAVTSFKNGKKRCDHTKQGTLDAAVAFGIGLFVVKNYLDQITYNVIASHSKEKPSWFERFTPPATPRGLAASQNRWR